MKNNKQQTAVEWFNNKVLSYKHSTNINGTDFIMIPVNKVEYLKQEAKEIEKKQIVNAVKYGYKKDYYTPNFKEQQELFEEYYIQTYGGNK